MRSPSKILLEITVLLVIVTIAHTYWRTILTKDFIVINDLEEETEELEPFESSGSNFPLEEAEIDS